MKGIKNELEKINITLKIGAKLVRQRPYHLNPIYKQKVREELNMILKTDIIEPIEEFEWISVMVK